MTPAINTGNGGGSIQGIDPQSGLTPSAPTQLVGRINGAGGVVSGTGFTVVRTSPGAYTIAFAPAFAATAKVYGSLAITPGASNAGTIRLPAAISPSGMDVQIINVDGTAAVDAEFYFTVTTQKI